MGSDIRLRSKLAANGRPGQAGPRTRGLISLDPGRSRAAVARPGRCGCWGWPRPVPVREPLLPSAGCLGSVVRPPARAQPAPPPPAAALIGLISDTGAGSSHHRHAAASRHCAEHCPRHLPRLPAHEDTLQQWRLLLLNLAPSPASVRM